MFAMFAAFPLFSMFAVFTVFSRTRDARKRTEHQEMRKSEVGSRNAVSEGRASGRAYHPMRAPKSGIWNLEPGIWNLEFGIWNSRKPGLKTPGRFRRFKCFRRFISFIRFNRFRNVPSPLKMKHPGADGNRNRYFAYIIKPTQSSSGLPMCSAKSTLRKK